ncbi:hypothetical protein NSK11_contig00063-0032 [Nocardia seriolae]|uniref:Uncharacterized protein n=1 Tax=Nocardia seriolae TaxID=37332 RepID=A0ABC9YWW4_9NOCA|nr:hypothetical protein NSERKGN1266_13430 [Nocardia seriolae]BEK98773.1 hypothetical protein NSER024013_66790 [Nocardia seriolae]GAM47881.1 hypothetical protein NS07_v2contig00060-0015 [Nocardia seriolae]GAP29761.1 hypothetical protein NSK11_contig00063-0032 [Nocardia seriolae]GEM25913.1 hypothetical protein NS2_41520 [Nocardia seriolae NBRC 15557]
MDAVAADDQIEDPRGGVPEFHVHPLAGVPQRRDGVAEEVFALSGGSAVEDLGQVAAIATRR